MIMTVEVEILCSCLLANNHAATNYGVRQLMYCT